MTDPEKVALVGQAVGVLGMFVALATMLWLRAKERREKAEREADRPPTPPAAPGQDRRDWHGVPAGKPR